MMRNSTRYAISRIPIDLSDDHVKLIALRRTKTNKHRFIGFAKNLFAFLRNSGNKIAGSRKARGTSAPLIWIKYNCGTEQTKTINSLLCNGSTRNITKNRRPITARKTSIIDMIPTS
jgi:hypothetical protein